MDDEATSERRLDMDDEATRISELAGLLRATRKRKVDLETDDVVGGLGALAPPSIAELTSWESPAATPDCDASSARRRCGHRGALQEGATESVATCAESSPHAHGGSVPVARV